MKGYREEFHPKIKSDLKKLDRAVALKIRDEHLDTILQDPYRSDKLKGKLSHLYAYHFKENSVDYRIAYSIENDIVIFYYMIAKRENFYKNVQKRL